MSREDRIADALEDLLERVIRTEQAIVRTERKVDRILEAQGRLETVSAETSKDVQVLRARLVEEAAVRAGIGRAVLEHDVELSLIRGGGMGGDGG